MCNLVIHFQVAELEEKLQAMDTEKAEMQNRIEDMEYDLSRTRSRCEKVESHLADTCQKLKAIQDESGAVAPGGTAKPGEIVAAGKITPAISSKKVMQANCFSLMSAIFNLLFLCSTVLWFVLSLVCNSTPFSILFAVISVLLMHL